MKDVGFPLGLTSPLTSGRVVREAQRALANNEYGRYLDGPADGVYGPETARATIRAKYWLGYEDEILTDDYGLALHAFLTGTAKLSYSQVGRRVKRQHKQTEKPLRLRALAEAEKWIGKTEQPPNSNRMPGITDWYQVTGPWCAMFTTRAYVDAGSKAFVRGRYYAYCPYVVNDARAGRNNLAITRNPQPGDLVLFDWAGDGVADHIGLFKVWRDRGRFLGTIEGNTSPTNQSNGGAVMARERSMNDVICFVHVGK